MAEIMDHDDRNISGRATAGLTTGIIGTALGLLGGGLSGLGWGNNSNNGGGYVTQDQADKSAEIAALNAKVALLEAGKDVDAKLVDVYDRLASRTLDLERSISSFKGDQAVVNAQLGASIAVNTNNISCIQNTLNSLTKVVIPSTNVCTQSTTSAT